MKYMYVHSCNHSEPSYTDLTGGINEITALVTVVVYHARDFPGIFQYLLVKVSSGICTHRGEELLFYPLHGELHRG